MPDIIRFLDRFSQFSEKAHPQLKPYNFQLEHLLSLSAVVQSYWYGEMIDWPTSATPVSRYAAWHYSVKHSSQIWFYVMLSWHGISEVGMHYFSDGTSCIPETVFGYVRLNYKFIWQLIPQPLCPFPTLASLTLIRTLAGKCRLGTSRLGEMRLRNLSHLTREMHCNSWIVSTLLYEAPSRPAAVYLSIRTSADRPFEAQKSRTKSPISSYRTKFTAPSE